MFLGFYFASPFYEEKEACNMETQYEAYLSDCQIDNCHGCVLILAQVSLVRL
jgi:hypothetical protein